MMQSQTIQKFIDQIIPHKTPCNKGFGKAPVNIALSKYWGKRDSELNLPTNSSLSISLPNLGTETDIAWIERSQPKLEVTLNHKRLPESDAFYQRINIYLEYFKPNSNGHFTVNTVNSVPTAAGLASSASGYAALVIALDDLFQWQLSKKSLSLLARLGSGSASRSVYDGFALWHKGEQLDGLDSFAESIDVHWKTLCIGLIEVDTRQKPISSTAGMQQTVKTCELYQPWPNKAEKDLKKIHDAILKQDLLKLGETAENNALAMHATMIATWPPIVYWQPDSIEAMQQVWQLREVGYSVFFTMDAGPNLKLIFEDSEEYTVRQRFPNIKIIKPFAHKSKT